jgi:hypothetical protein
MRFLNKGNGVIGKVRIKSIFILVCGLFALKLAYEWNIEFVDRAGSGYNSIDIDSLGQPHVAYFTGTGLRYAYKDSTDWHIQNVAESCGQYLSLKLSHTGKPKISHISYISHNPTGKLIYSYIQNDTWCHITVDTLQTCKHSSLALDSIANPCISYLCGEWLPDETLKVKYAHQNDSIWDIQLVDTTPPYIGWIFDYKATSIALDNFSKPHIAYGYDGIDMLSEEGFTGVKYAYLDSSWIVSHIYFINSFWTSFEFDKICLKLNQINQSHLSYNFSYYYPPQSTYVVNYEYNDPGSGWQIIRLSDTLARISSLDVDSLNRAHIVYLSENRLMYAIWDGNNWTFDTITTGNFSGEVSLKLDQDDNPHICFFSNGLRYAYGSPTGIEEIKNQNAISLTSEIYPNPVKGVLRLRGPFSEKIKIFDVSGKLVKEKITCAKGYKQEITISLKGINPGIYFLRLGKETKKFLVVK